MIAFTVFSQETGTDIIRGHNEKRNKKQKSLGGLTLGILKILSLSSHIKKIMKRSLGFPFSNCASLTGTVIKFPTLFWESTHL